MGVVTATVDGTSIMPYLRGRSLQIDHYINQRPVLKCELNTKFTGDAYRALINKDIIVTDGGTRVFGGVTYNVVEDAVINLKARNMKVDGVGYEVYADKTLINGIVAGGTLKSQITAVVANIGHSIIVDAAQGVGPTMPALGFPFATCRAALDQLSLISNYIYRFDHFKNVKFIPIGSEGAPFALTAANSSLTKTQVTWSLQNYINSVWVQFGSTTQQQVTVTLHGDSSTRLFPLGYTPASPPSTLTVNGTTYPVGIYSVDTGFNYYYRQDDPFFPYSIIQDPGAPAPNPLSPSDTMVVTFTAQFPGAVQINNSGEVAANGYFAEVLQAPDVYDRNVAIAMANGELARHDSLITTVTMKTLLPGLSPGMTVNVTVSERGLPGINYLITAVKMRHLTTQPGGSQVFEYEISGVEGNRYQPWASWSDYFRRLSSSSAGSSGATVTTSGGSTSAPTVITYAYWGGSRTTGRFANATWVDTVDFFPVRITGNGQPVSVRVFQATDNSGTSVQSRIVQRVGVVDTAVATSATTTNTRGSGFSEQFLTFTPNLGAGDYVLQVKGGNGNASVFNIGMSV